MMKTMDQIHSAMKNYKYIADDALVTTIFLSQALEKPVLLEGEPGVGKTEVAKVISKILDTKLIRLQCYEGLDVSTALYEWNYPKQILSIKMGEVCKNSKEELEHSIFTEKYLLKRPLLEAIQSEGTTPPVLLIDEIDRADEEFEAFLIEVLSDFQISIPEIGTLKAHKKPVVILTSNRTRELHDALKRRCLFQWIDYPTFEKEYEIIITKIPGIKDILAKQICRFMQDVRKVDFHKKPGVSETLDWAGALIALNRDELDDETIEKTLGCIFKFNEDIKKFKTNVKKENEKTSKSKSIYYE